jgi:hypothetical protein
LEGALGNNEDEEYLNKMNAYEDDEEEIKED